MIKNTKVSVPSAAWIYKPAAIAACLVLGACAADNGASILAATGEGANDPYAFSSIRDGDWGAAEDNLRAGKQGDPLRLLNLAYVLTRQGQNDEAADVYRAILNGSDNPYATMGGGQPRRIKRVALQQLLALDAQN